MAFWALSSGMKLAAAAAMTSVVAVPVVSISTNSALNDQVSERTVGDVSQSTGGVGSKKGMTKPGAVLPAEPAPAPVYRPAPPLPAPAAATPPPPAAPVSTATVAAPQAKSGIGGILLPVLGAAAIIGGIVLASSNDDDEPASPS